MEKKMFMTLAGYLEYLQKPGYAFSKPKFKKHWFIFDENSCSLNYYVDRNANTLEPIGKIDMTNVTISPIGEAGHTNEFEISCGDKKVHRFKVADWKEASDWIRKLEQKREGWCKSAVKKQSNKQQQARANRTLSGMKPYDSKRPAERSSSLNHSLRHFESNGGSGLLERDSQDDEIVIIPSSAVKEVFMGTLQQEKGGLLFRNDSHDSVDSERCKSAELYETDTMDGEKDTPPNPPQRSQSLFAKAVSDPNMLDHMNSSDENSYEDNTLLTSTPSEQVNYKRRMWMLEEKCQTAQREITIQTRKNIDLKKELKKSQTEVEELRKEVAELKKLKELSNLPEAQLRVTVIELQDLVNSYDEQKKLLLDDLKLRMNQHQEYENAIQEERRKYSKLEQELLKFKAKYVKLLGNSIKINATYTEPVFVDPEEEQAKKSLLELLRNEAVDNFPFHGKTFEDQYGDLHDWASGNEVQHFLCNNLYIHYTAADKEKHEKAWGEFMKIAKRSYSEAFEKSDRQLRTLLRHGIPFDLRSKIWTILVNKEMGRLRELKNQSAQPNGYYQSLVRKSQNSPDLKQIMVDLDRTMPQNKHFRKDSNGQGLSHMKNILLAYSIHNPNLGYCQGMNMLVAVGLLFLDEETTFWLLVMLIDKMTPRDYYTPGLLGAQADQALMRSLVAEKLPQLDSHLQTCGVDIAVITFNWLLAAFVDALPTESMLRIWDCFLYEGRKVLYRFALGILKLYERKIIQISDTNHVLSYLKKLPKHIFYVEDLFTVAFIEFEPFPSRQALMKRHENHMQKVEATFKEEEKLREAAQKEFQKKELKDKKSLIKSRTLSSNLLSETITANRKPPIWECGCVITDDEVWLGCGERQGAKVCVINCGEEKLKLDIPLREFTSRLCCMKSVRKDMVVFGTLDFTIHAVNSIEKKELWSIKVKDSVLDVVGSDDNINLFVGLADGTVAIILATDNDPPPPCPLLIRIGTEPVSCMVLTTNNELWCGSGSSVSIISSTTMEPLKSLSGAERRALYKMAVGSHGIWMSYRSSPLITLYHATHHVRLLEIDYTSSLNLNPLDDTFCDSQVNLDQRITSILSYGDFLWIGTGGGCVCVFSIQPNCGNVAAKLDKLIAKETAKAESFFEQSVVYQHGLIGVEDTVTEYEEKQKNRYRRRNEFGRTFHTKFTSSGKKEEEDTDIFKLEFLASHNLTSEHADAVRVMIPLSYKSNSYIVTCCRVRKMNEASKSVQLWYAPKNQHPQKWQYQFIDCNTIVMHASSVPPIKIAKHSKADLKPSDDAITTEHRKTLDKAS